MYDCVVLIFSAGEKPTKKRHRVLMLIFMFALYLQYMSQGHHCSPLLFAKNADYLQTVNCLCTYWRTSNLCTLLCGNICN